METNFRLESAFAHWKRGSHRRKVILGSGSRVPDAFIETRHYYTHWDKALEPEILDGVAMHYAGMRLKLFLRALYLQIAGLSDDLLTAALENLSVVSQELKQTDAQEHLWRERRRDPAVPV